MIYDIIVLGAGASGLMFASHIPKSKKVLLIDANEKIAKKIKISGGGKCNITNKFVSEKNYIGDNEFIKKTFDKFNKDDLLLFLEKNGLKPILKKNKYYFCPKSSDEIIEIFKKLTNKHSFLLNTKVLHVEKDNDLFLIKTDKKILKSKKVVVATGGESYKTIGASDIALKIAKDFNIQYNPFKPALVGWTVQKEQFWFKELSGISVDVVLHVKDKTFKDSLLFTHKGISGPSVLNGSLYWEKGKVSLDFLPQVDIKKLLNQDTKKQLSSILPLPKRFIKAFLNAINLKDKPLNKLTNEEKEMLYILKDYTFSPAGNFGFSKAEVSLGGVLVEELEENFQSKKVKGLYFIGEAVDITGELGGYNFQWAFSSGYVCAKFK